MATKAYPTRSKIYEASQSAGHVASFENGVTTIETGDITLTFDRDSKITDAEGKEYTNVEAAEVLDIEIR